jgi:hypothetical protein
MTLTEIIENNPWGCGIADDTNQVEILAPGIARISTAAHGGIVIDEAHVALLPDVLYQNIAGDPHYWEEDEEWTIPSLVFADEIKLEPNEKETARRVLNDAAPGLLDLIERGVVRH